MRAARSPDRTQTIAGAISHRRTDRTYSTSSWCEPDRRPSARPIRRSACDDEDRLHTVATILPTGLAEPVRQPAYRTPSPVVLLRITRISGDRGRAGLALSPSYSDRTPSAFGTRRCPCPALPGAAVARHPTSRQDRVGRCGSVDMGGCMPATSVSCSRSRAPRIGTLRMLARARWQRSHRTCGSS